MDYFVGGVAALISGNVTPNRPRLVKKALTPVKHPASPNVTPKSVSVNDKSLFLSPTMQRKKAIVKKSPKRIFQNPDLQEELNITSPKADRVKKHLTDDLESESLKNVSKKKKNINDSAMSISPNKSEENSTEDSVESASVVKKSKKSKNIASFITETSRLENDQNQIKKKKKFSLIQTEETSNIKSTVENSEETQSSPKSKQNKKRNNKIIDTIETPLSLSTATSSESTPTKKKKKKKHVKESNKRLQEEVESKKKIKQVYVNPNAITHQDTDSEHESDNEIQSENEEEMKNDIEKAVEQETSDEEESNVQKTKNKAKKKEKEHKPNYQPDADEVKRTIFVGNVPFSKKCKKEIKKIFLKHGAIETVRVRAVPLKDPRSTRKLAVIKSDLHPDRGTVNVYVKFRDQSSVEKALSENNTLLGECHLRVSRSDTTGAHDQNKALFIGNLPFAIEDETLRAKFEKCGEIESVRVIRDKNTNVGKGFGYVNFTSKDGVELALSLPEEELTIKNRVLRLKRCTLGDSRKHKHHGGRNHQSNKKNADQSKKNQNQVNEKTQGAFRRITNKRKPEGPNAEGPPNKKRKNIDQADKVKKPKKEYLGITAEKKKKKNFIKGQKKKKFISELLTN